MKVKDLLTKENWIQGRYATDNAGNELIELHPSACKFCLVGVLRKCYGVGTVAYWTAAAKIYEALKVAGPVSTIS